MPERGSSEIPARSGAGFEPACASITEPLRPATNDERTGPPGLEPGPARLELAMLCGYTTGLMKRTTRLERVSPGWRPGALPHELRPREIRPAGIEPAASAFARQRSLSAELRACEEPPAGVEPAPRPYEGRVLSVDTTEASRSEWRRRESNPLLLVASEVLFPMSFIPNG